MNALTKAAQDVLAERQRQIEKEGWTPEHDDDHRDGSMARAAAAYCLCAEGPPKPGEPSEFHQSRPWDFNILSAIWPRSWYWPRPKDRRTNLVRAGALILAEIERLDRAASKVRVTNGRHGCERCDGEPECTCGVVLVGAVDPATNPPTVGVHPFCVAACLCGQPIRDECKANGCRWDKEKNRG